MNIFEYVSVGGVGGYRVTVKSKLNKFKHVGGGGEGLAGGSCVMKFNACPENDDANFKCTI